MKLYQYYLSKQLLKNNLKLVDEKRISPHALLLKDWSNHHPTRYIVGGLCDI